MTFGKIMLGVHYLLLAVCLGCVGMLLLDQAGSWTSVFTETLVEWPLMLMPFVLPGVFLFDAVGLVIRHPVYRQHWGQVLVLDFAMGVLWVRAFALMESL